MVPIRPSRPLQRSYLLLGDKMKKKKQVRRKPLDPRGGFFRMYSELWLNDKELIDAGDDAQAGYVRMMAGVNEIDFLTGSFNTNGYPLPKAFILDLCRLTDQVFTKLEQLGKIKKDDKEIYYLPNWDKYQDKSRVHGNSYRVDAPSDALPDAQGDDGMTALRREEGNKGIREEIKTPKKETANNGKDNGDSKMPLELKNLLKQEISLYEMIQKPGIGDEKEALFKAELTRIQKLINQYRKDHHSETTLSHLFD